MTHTVFIPAWHPTRLNRLLGDWRRASRLKKADGRMLAAACILAGVPRATGKRRVSLEIVLGPRQRGGDPDCWFKSLLDGLVACGALVNDSREWVEISPVTYSRADMRATRIVLEDMP